MIAPSAGVQILVARQPVDFRKGADGLAAMPARAGALGGFQIDERDFRIGLSLAAATNPGVLHHV
jgi:hypothetical protein